MHYARIARSPRLQRVRALLADGAEHSTMDIVAGAGADIACRQIVSVRGERLFLYRLLGAAAVPQPGAPLPHPHPAPGAAS